MFFFKRKTGIITIAAVAVLSATVLLLLANYTFSAKSKSEDYPIDNSLLLTSFIKEDLKNYASLKKPDVRDELLALIEVRSLSSVFEEPAEPEVFVDEKAPARTYDGNEESRSPQVKAPPATVVKKKPVKKRTSFYYHVKNGDSLWKLSKKFRLRITTIVSANGLGPRSLLKRGQILFIPQKDGIYHKVKRGENLYYIAGLYGANVKAIISANKIVSPDLLQRGQRLFVPNAKYLPRSKSTKRFIWPINGRITSAFGIRQHPIYKRKIFHRGIDISSGGRRKKIHAAAGGTVVYSGWYGGYGRMVLIRHKNGYYTQYAHNSKNYVKKGQKVKQGQVIGLTGRTGRTTGLHLHFEIRKGRKVLNPIRYLKHSS